MLYTICETAVSLDKTQFKDLVIVPALQILRLDSQSARELLLGTALQESGLKYLKQLNNGPALGLFQMEPATHDDIWKNFMRYQGELTSRMNTISRLQIPEVMITHLLYAAAMCRIHYYRVKEALPAAGDLEGQAKYWKKYYNTTQGAGTVDEYTRNWRKAHN